MSRSPNGPTPFRVGFVSGVTPDKWRRRWRERMREPLIVFPVVDADQRSVLDDGRAEMCFVRLPIDPDGLHVISLYAEDFVVVLALEHVLTLLDEVSHADLVGEILNDGPVATAVETAAAGTGVVLVPRSVARLHARQDLTTRPLVGDEGSQVALAWRRDLEDERVEDFVGIVRGRTAQSSRGRARRGPPG